MSDLDRLSKAELVAKLEAVTDPQVEALARCVTALEPLTSKRYVPRDAMSAGHWTVDTDKVERVLDQLAVRFGLAPRYR